VGQREIAAQAPGGPAASQAGGRTGQDREALDSNAELPTILGLRGWRLGLWEWSPGEPDLKAKPGSDGHLETLFSAFIEIRARKL